MTLKDLRDAVEHGEAALLEDCGDIDGSDMTTRVPMDALRLLLEAAGTVCDGETRARLQVCDTCKRAEVRWIKLGKHFNSGRLCGGQWRMRELIVRPFTEGEGDDDAQG